MKELRRREFLRTAGGLVAGSIATVLAGADDLPKNTSPRAIAGDPVEPDWDQRVTITVGPKDADIVGTTDRAIQAAVDYVARREGGTVRLLPGTYRLRNSIFLQSKVRLLGSGADSVLFKEPSVVTRISVDGDHWDREIALADPKGFQVGDGVRLVAKDPYGKGTTIVQRTLIASSGNRFKLDRRLEERFHLEGEPQVATNFALLQCTGVSDVEIEDIAVDGNKAHNEMIDRGAFDDGSIRLDESNRIALRRVTVREFYCVASSGASPTTSSSRTAIFTTAPGSPSTQARGRNARSSGIIGCGAAPRASTSAGERSTDSTRRT